MEKKPVIGVQSAHSCKYATPTLLEPAPRWVEAEVKPWTCHRGGTPVPLDDTEVCEGCPRWEPR